MKSTPFAPASYTDEVVAAVKAVAAGNASPGQQKACLEWIVHQVAMTYDETFVPAQPDLSDYLAGRRNVGLQIMKLVNVPTEKLTRKDKP